MQRPYSLPVTVVLPTFNRASRLPVAIESVLGQTFGDFEFLIIDDASTDNTRDVVHSYNDARIRYIRNSVNLGVAASTNRGIREAKGEFIARMDSDDRARPRRFELQFDYMKSCPDIGVSGGQMLRFHDGVAYPMNQPCEWQECLAALLFHSCILQPTLMLRRDVIFKNNMFYDERFRAVEDYELWTRLARVTRITNLPDVLVEYNCHEGQLSAKWSNASNELRMIPHQRMLQLLGMSDRETIEYVYAAGMLFRPFTLDDLQAYELIFEKILVSNRGCGVFDQEVLRGVLCKQYARVCNHVSDAGWATVRQLTNSDFLKDVGLSTKFKLYMRLVLQHFRSRG